MEYIISTIIFLTIETLIIYSIYNQIKFNLKKKTIPSVNVTMKIEYDEISEGEFMVIIKESSIDLDKFYENDIKKSLIKMIQSDGYIVKNLNYRFQDVQKKRTRIISQNVKDRVWNRDGGKCVQCGSNENLEFDHIIPFSKGGANTYRNIQLLCEPCNRGKSDKIG